MLAVCCRYLFYTPGWRETMWGKVSCMRKKHGGRAEPQTTDFQIWSPTHWSLHHHTPQNIRCSLLSYSGPIPSLNWWESAHCWYTTLCKLCSASCVVEFWKKVHLSYLWNLRSYFETPSLKSHHSWWLKFNTPPLQALNKASVVSS